MKNKKINTIIIFFIFTILITRFITVFNLNVADGEEYNKIAYITFDDGPTKYTNQIIDILDKNGVKGTFFMMNTNMMVFKDTVKRIVEEGHGAGFHGVTHDLKKLYETENSAIEEFKTCNETFYNITGKNSKIIRIPFGSKPNMIESIYQKFVDEGFLIWDWTIDTEDWKSTKDQIVSNVLYYARDKDEIVILLHENERTINSLDDIIKILKIRGYNIQPITEKSKPKNFW